MTAVTVTVTVQTLGAKLCDKACPYKSPRIARVKPLSATCTLFSAPIEYADQDDDTDYTTLRCVACRWSEVPTPPAAEGKG